jgi:hypothetical protein
VSQFGQQVRRNEAAPERTGIKVLDERVERAGERRARQSLRSCAARAPLRPRPIPTPVSTITLESLLAGDHCGRRVVATAFGEPICSTWSTGVKSTPRSRLDVQTTALSLLRRRPSSTQSRTSRSSEP